MMNLAKLIHEINRAYCQSIGDDSQPPWEEAPDWHRKISRDAVQFLIDNPQAGPENLHNKWLSEKERAGWKYAPVRNVEKKEHPCMVPFCELSQEDRTKDHLVLGAVRAVLS